MKLHAGQQGTFLCIHTASVTALCSFKTHVLNLHSNIKLMAAAYSSFIKITIRTLVIDSVILAAYGTSLRGIAQKWSLGLTGACSPLYQQELKKKFVSSGSDPVHAGSEASVHYSSCFPVGLMGTGWWAEQTLSRQETSGSSCFCMLTVWFLPVSWSHISSRSTASCHSLHWLLLLNTLCVTLMHTSYSSLYHLMSAQNDYFIRLICLSLYFMLMSHVHTVQYISCSYHIY